MTIGIRILLAAGIALTPPHIAAAQDTATQDTAAQNEVAEDKAQSANPGQDWKVAATVNDVPILVADVELSVRQALGQRKANEHALPLLQAAALDQLIDQERVLVQLRQRDEACTEQELDVELKRRQADQERLEKSLEDLCHTLKIPRPSLRRMIAWQLSWKRCRAKNLTEENLQHFFEKHRQEFDGTSLRVAQVLLKKDAQHDRQQLLQQAADIRQKVVDGELSFADAARKYSQAPSAEEGGDQGWISRHEPMPEYFSKAAFRLQVDEVSEPVASLYGVHLILCLESKPGQKKWQDVRKPLSSAASRHLFRWLADRAAPKTEVKFTGNCPHFEPGTQRLVK